nr:zinc finger, PMZ-type [Tanacetum cinerariifolium]
MKDPAGGVSDFYSKRAWQNCYSSFIKPVGGQSMWVKTGLPPPMPSKKRVMPDKPKGKRQKHPSKANDYSCQRVSRFGRTMTCSNCYQRGHNRKGCENETIDPTPKEEEDADPANTNHANADPVNADHANADSANADPGEMEHAEMEQPVHME